MITTPEQAIAQLFLTPFITNRDNHTQILNKQFLGIFYKDTNKPQWEEKIILAYEYTGSLYYVDRFFEKSEYAYESYTDTIDNKTYKIYSFTIPPNLKKDFNHIIKGEYTNISLPTITKLQSFWRIKTLYDKIGDYCSNNKTRFSKHHVITQDAILNLNHVLI